MDKVAILRLVSPVERKLAEPLVLEYLHWNVDRLDAEYGRRLSYEDVERQHRRLDAELDAVVAGAGRLLLATVHGERAGVGVLKPAGAGVAEIKRMYVRPSARGQGVARALLARLVADARAEGFGTVRLETLTFMKEAQALYRSLGFVDCPAFASSELDGVGLAAFTLSMQRSLDA